MEWKLTDDRPIWLQLSEQLARQIVSDVYPPGGKLPVTLPLSVGQIPCHYSFSKQAIGVRFSEETARCGRSTTPR